jgi:hypothetical protein
MHVFNHGVSVEFGEAEYGASALDGFDYFA